MIRSALRDDAATLARLLHDFNTEFDTPVPAVVELTERFGRALADERAFALLADRPITGFAFVSVRPSIWYSGLVASLDELYVTPSDRNNGVGTDLLRALERELRQRRIGALEINVDGVDVDARRFYERHGYRNTEDGQTEPMYYYFKEFGASSL